MTCGREDEARMGEHPAGGGGHAYYCVRCRTELSFARVEAMSANVIYWTCPCSGVVRRTEYVRDGAALRRLFGPSIRPVLPYTAAPRRASALPPELETECASFARAWSGIAYPDEFHLLCDAARQALGEPPVVDDGADDE